MAVVIRDLKNDMQTCICKLFYYLLRLGPIVYILRVFGLCIGTMSKRCLPFIR